MLEPMNAALTSIYQRRRALKSKLRLLIARIRRARSGATFIAVTGSSGKSTTVNLLAHILSGDAQTLHQFLVNGLRDSIATIRNVEPSDKYAIVECGTEKPGDIRPQAELLKPSISIVTLVGIEHYSAFRTAAAIANEKAELLRALSADGLAVLNFDDALVRAMSADTKARVVGFGQKSGDYKVGDLRLSPAGALSLSMTPPDGGAFEITTTLLGKHNWLAVAAAATCALELGMSRQLITARTASFKAVHGRLSVHSIPGGPRFILDTVKAPWFSLMLPLEVVREISAPRKRIILGQISDYAGNSRTKYREACRAALDVADEVILVGPYAHRFTPSPEVASAGRFRAFHSIQDCARYVRESAVEGEVILVKSALNLHLDRIWLNFIDDVHCWAAECGMKGVYCHECLYQTPFPEHPPRKNYPRPPPRNRRLFKAEGNADLDHVS
ncbi:MAG: Mur ligase [Proteobacteria bacterium]|nr:Mur ligase [Pseudomonadota bacterium]